MSNSNRLLTKIKRTGTQSSKPGIANWMEQMKKRDPEAAAQVMEVIKEFVRTGRVGKIQNKSDIYRWLIAEGVDMRCKYTSFSRLIREMKEQGCDGEEAKSKSETC